MLYNVRIRLPWQDHFDVYSIANSNLQRGNDLVRRDKVRSNDPNFYFSLVDSGKNCFHTKGSVRIGTTCHQASRCTVLEIKLVSKIGTLKRKFLFSCKMPAQKKLEL